MKTFRVICAFSAGLVLLMAIIFFAVGIARAGELACFAATAYNDFGESDYSEVVCNEPEIPVEVGGSVRLAWDASAGATGYKIYYRPIGVQDWREPVDVGNALTTTIPAAAIFCPEAEPTGMNIVDVVNP